MERKKIFDLSTGEVELALDAKSEHGHYSRQGLIVRLAIIAALGDSSEKLKAKNYLEVLADSKNNWSDKFMATLMLEVVNGKKEV